MNDGPLDDDPFDDDFFPSKAQMAAGGVVSIVLTIVFYAVLLAVLLAVGLWVLQQFNVLMVSLAVVA